MSSEVYFVNVRAQKGASLLEKLERLIDRSGLMDIVAPNDLVAIKLHFGERGNTAYIRPQFIRRIVNKVKAKKGKPFLTDANTLYVGSRANAVDHLETAIENGFDYAVVGAPLIIADGLTGKDYIKVPVNLKHFKEVNIGSAAVLADALIAVTHFKGHEATGFGGTLKNIGMGLGSRSGKQQMHSDLLPEVNTEICTGCRKCARWCPAQAISYENGKAVINYELCIGCGECTVTCNYHAIKINWKDENDVIQEKIVEYTYGVLKDKKGKAAFITFLTDISPDCDCCSWNDVPLVPDIGILASFDPIAIDQAAVDLVNNAASIENSVIGKLAPGVDKIKANKPSINWEKQLIYGEAIGLGSRKYKLIEVK